MEGSRSEKWAGVIIASLCMVLVLSQGSLLGSIPQAESIGGGSRGSSELTWIQTTQMDFENGTLTDVTATLTGEVKLGLMLELLEDSFVDESGISHTENLTLDTVAGEVRLSWFDGLLINKTFGGTEEDYGYSAQRASDGGYIIVGGTASYGAGNRDAWLIKTDSSGNEQWNRTFGGSELDDGYSVQQTSDGGYIIAGSTRSFGAGYSGVWLIKTDSSGNEQWNRTFGGSESDGGHSVQQTSDNGYIIAGATESYGSGYRDVWLIKTDSLGNEQWNKTFGGSQWELGLTVQQTSDNGYVVTADTKSYGAGNSDVWLIKTDSSGSEEWNRTFGGSERDYGMSFQQTSDNGYIIAGATESYGSGYRDVWLIKTDSLGNEQWNKTFGGDERDEGQTAQQTSDNGYIIAGATSSYGASEMDIWLIKTDSSGNEEWNKTFGGGKWDVPSFHWFGHAIHQISDNEYMVVGTTESFGAGDWDIWLIKFNASGRPKGSLASVDLLPDQNVHSIDAFEYVAIIPAGSEIRAQFSKDNLAWYDSNGNLNQWDTLSDGSNLIDLSGLGWQGFGFQYQMVFTSSYADMPILRNITVSYSQYLPTGILESEPFDSVTYASWKTLNWSATKPPRTELRLQLRSASSLEGLVHEAFVGLDGTPVSFYTTSGQSACECHERDRWLQYKAFLSTANPSTTPILEDVTITYEPIDTDDDDIPDFEDLDDDNDGLPDSWESQHDLDSLNYSDAFEDSDFDTLKNIQEYQNGTNPLDNDTDGDGLGDGFEFAFSNTDPTAWDTYGNGVGDGLEFVQTQSYFGIMQSLPDDRIGITIAWDGYIARLRTNSTVLDGEFEKGELKLGIRVSGPDGSQGFTEIEIPKDFCASEDIEIKLDDHKIDYSLTQSDSYCIIRVDYTHSIHDLTADFGNAISGAISGTVFYLIASAAAIVTVLMLIVVTKYRKGREKIEVQELPPEKLSMLLEKKRSEGEMTKRTYDDIKSLLRKYGSDGDGE